MTHESSEKLQLGPTPSPAHDRARLMVLRIALAAVLLSLVTMGRTLGARMPTSTGFRSIQGQDVTFVDQKSGGCDRVELERQ
jgi:hypothetical protein